MCEGMTPERALLRRLAARPSSYPQMASSCNCPLIRVCSSTSQVLEGGIQMADGQATQQQGEQSSSACAGCGAPAPVPKYEADGTVHVRYGSCGEVDSVTFIPLKYVEQSGSKFVVFVPRERQECCAAACCRRSCKIGKSLTVKVSGCGAAKGVELVCAENFRDPLLHAAARGIKVTVVVSCCSNGNLALRGIVVPAIPKPAT